MPSLVPLSIKETPLKGKRLIYYAYLFPFPFHFSSFSFSFSFFQSTFFSKWYAFLSFHKLPLKGWVKLHISIHSSIAFARVKQRPGKCWANVGGFTSVRRPLAKKNNRSLVAAYFRLVATISFCHLFLCKKQTKKGVGFVRVDTDKCTEPILKFLINWLWKVLRNSECYHWKLHKYILC